MTQSLFCEFISHEEFLKRVCSLRKPTHPKGRMKHPKACRVADIMVSDTGWSFCVHDLSWTSYMVKSCNTFTFLCPVWKDIKSMLKTLFHFFFTGACL